MNNTEKLAMHTRSVTDENFRTLAKLFPNVVTETIDENGKVVRAIDADVLVQEINSHVVSGKEERYQFTWPDKRKSILLANAPLAAALRPCREESVDFDSTENLYIEGDNLDVLKLLRETYLNRVKMIYIDPPYNTGNDFVYDDDYSEETGEFLRRDGQYDEQGNRLTPNLDSNGRFHTDWLNMIYPRLRVARDLLTDDGVIFISIDDNEAENMRKLCNEVLGDSNFVAQLVWERAYAPKNDAKYISNSHDYIIMYAKSINKFQIGRLPRTEEANARYANPDNDPRGVWKPSDMSVKTYNPNSDYTIITPSGREIEPPAGRCWSLSKNAFFERLKDNRIWFGHDGNSVPSIKRFISELKYDGMAPTSILFYKEVGHSQEGAKEVTSLIEAGAFDGPKPIRLLSRLLTLANLDGNSIILDFFSGSATTAHAVMRLNSEDGGKRKFIMVQIPEVCDEKSEAGRAGYKNICEIGKQRIRRAGQKVKNEAGLAGQDLDVGFRVLKLDSSNMKDVYYKPEEINQIELNLDVLTDNIKPDRTDEDLLFQVMLDLGIPLSAKIKQDGKLFYVNDNYLIACFGRSDTALITEIAKKRPYYAVFRDASFVNDSAMVNFKQVFATYSPSTKRRVL
ncbi:site-specific DNA-methyltransferase [Ferroacidibacillus organovorans]|nr:site-specific DNA-methyltransferase [Ferroacidibacillus organovorans]